LIVTDFADMLTGDITRISTGDRYSTGIDIRMQPLLVQPEVVRPDIRIVTVAESAKV
jgi:hypothetical protein